MWDHISKQKSLSEEFIREHQHRLNWMTLSSCYPFSKSGLEEFKTHFFWGKISFRQALSYDFIVKNWHHVSFLRLKRNKRIQLSEEEWFTLLQKEKKKLYEHMKIKNPDWDFISKEIYLEESFIEEHRDEVNWFDISERQILSEDFIKKYKKQVEWKRICRMQKISESFIIEMKDYVSWRDVSCFTVPSEPFIEQMKDYINWESFKRNPFLSKEIKVDYIKKYKKGSAI